MSQLINKKLGSLQIEKNSSQKFTVHKNIDKILSQAFY